MKMLLFTIIIGILVFIVAVDTREKPEHLLTKADKVERMLEDYTFNTPKQISVLYQQEHEDKKTRERVKVIVLQTNEEYLPKSPKMPDSFQTVLNELKIHIPDQDFGEQVAEKAAYFQWLSPNSSWVVTSIETTNGHFSRWEKRADVHQLSNE